MDEKEINQLVQFRILFKTRTLRILILRQFFEDPPLSICIMNICICITSLKTGVKKSLQQHMYVKIYDDECMGIMNAIPNPYVQSLKIVNPQ